jgi:hypothetical protein
MKHPIVLRFDARGAGQCLYTERIDLSEIGSLRMRRASFVEFNETAQQWEVKDSSGSLLHVSRSRQACLVWEQRHFNQ